MTSEPTTATSWVSDEVRAEFGTYAFAVYVYFPQTGRELVTRNLPLADAERYASVMAVDGRRVHVSLDTCG